MLKVDPPVVVKPSEAAEAQIGALRTDSLSMQEPKVFRESLDRPNMVKKLSLPLHYVKSQLRGQQYRAAFQDVKTYCLFIGHGRSGHSIFGALLDAHPNVIIPDESDILRYVGAGFNKIQICYLLLAKSQAQAKHGRKKDGLGNKTYSYQVPGQWQGQFDKLQVIGDTQAGISTQRLARNPDLLPRLQDIMGETKVKVFHVIRNPYDNISTLMLRDGRSFENAIERYFANCQTITQLRKRISSDDLLPVRHEEFLAQPQARLKEICDFMGVTAEQTYLDACAGILYKSPSQSRSKVAWTADLIDLVQRQINEFDFLAGYSYQN
jgi:hypothetical protein